VGAGSPLLWRKAMTSLLATSRKHFAAALGLHARTESVRFGAAAFPRLKSTLWQDNPTSYSLRLWKTPSAIVRAAPGGRRTEHPRWLQDSPRQAHCRSPGSFRNLLVYLPYAGGVKKARGIVTDGGKVIHLSQGSPISILNCVA
jgi:hypothetical protein